ncbi:glycosyltransferase [Caulobacter sp. S45]|uniref:glycosyltransferase n=1 Tax=Caulobacter sp. S45 TaxID=1641861 RepID=UPI00131DBE2E|nr:glycosyltransferase [Caulobacter sp. S45]
MVQASELHLYKEDIETRAGALESPTPSTAAIAFAKAVEPRPLLIAVPLYRRPELAHQVLQSLINRAEEVRRLEGELILFNDSPDDSALGEALDVLLPMASAAFPCRVIRNEVNLGFVRTCNFAFDEAAARGMDLLLLNSDTVVTPGALTEMARISRLDPMIGFVNPRSNNATLATLPFQDQFRHLPPAAAHATWKAIADHLPEISYVPTAVGFCILIRWAVLAEFGGFDEIYGMGYNEENDLVMRAGRRGYRAALANHAFVWHEGHGSFHLEPKTNQLDAKNRKILLARYPEYSSLTEAYFGSPEQRAECLLGTMVPDANGRLEVALDFSSFVPAHNGTTEAGNQLLSAAAQHWGGRFSLSVLCSEDAYAFHGYARYGVARRDPHGPELYAAIFRVGQPYDWSVLERLALKAASFGLFMLDTISIDCTPLYSPRLHSMWSFTLEHADMIATTSEMTEAQFGRRFQFGPGVLRPRSLHSLDLADYRLPVAPVGAAPVEPGYLFVIGNHYWHKDIAASVRALTEADPERRIVVLSGPGETSLPVDQGLHCPRGLEAGSNVLQLETGQLTIAQMGALYRGAVAVVFPSHYEGFGMPVLNALAAGRPVFVRPLPVFAELERALGGEANIHVFDTTADLVRALRNPPAWCGEGASNGRPGDAARAVADIGAALDAMVAGVSYQRIVKRIREIQTLHDFSNIRFESAASRTASDSVTFTARRIGHLSERGARALLAIPGAFVMLRWCYRAARRLFGLSRIEKAAV